MSVSEAIEAYLRIHGAIFIQGQKSVSVEERTYRLQNVIRELIQEHLTPEEQATRFSEFTKLVPGCMVCVYHIHLT